MKRVAILSFVIFFVAGCAVGPNYKKPAVDTPGVYRGLTPEDAAKNDVRSLADEKWWEVFQDEQLKELIRTALQQNYDLRIAAARVLQARAQLGITRADQFPTISGQAGAMNERSPQSKFVPAFETSASQVGLGFNWELDFWGRFRRATEAARASLVATEWSRREIITELVANVASAYFTLRALASNTSLAPHGICCSREGPIQIRCSADQRQVRKRLRKVSQVPAVPAQLLRVQPQMIGVT